VQWRLGRQSYLPLLLFFFFLFFFLPRGFRLKEGVLPPPCILTTSQATLQSRILYLRTRNFSLWAQFTSCLTVSSGKVPPPPVACCEHAQDYVVDMSAMSKSNCINYQR
jgi:hypothetical protein